VANDLVFRKAPLAGPPNVLIFGEPQQRVTAAFALGRIALPAFMLAGAALVTMPPQASASGALPLPTFMVSGSVRYTSSVSRPLVGKVEAGWQGAAQVEGGALAAHQNAAPARVSCEAGWQDARAVAADSGVSWQSVATARASAAIAYQAAEQLQMDAAMRHQEAQRCRTELGADWQAARELSTWPVEIRHQSAQGMRRDAATRWQEAIYTQIAHVEGFGVALQAGADTVVRWQAAMPPPPGRSVIPPPVIEPCHVPSTVLLFRQRQDHATTLIFMCDRHLPAPGTGTTVVVPILEAYSVHNSISLVRLDSGEALEALAFSMSLDADSWTWRWSATLPGEAWAVVRRGIHSAPVEILATVNGVPYRLAATECNRDRRFGESRVQVQGKGRGAILDAPYADVLNHAAAAPSSVRQLLDLALTYNGVPVGWGVDFKLTDWAVPGGTWAFQGTHIAAVLDIASAAGAIVQPHATEPVLRVLPRYPAAPWHWNDLAPDFVLPSRAVSVEGIQPLTKPNYTRVFVAGTNGAGVMGQATRAGSAGDRIAPMVTHALTTHVDAVRQRGISVLGDTGAQSSVNLKLQVRPETGVILPNALVRYEDGAETYLGLVRSVAVDWQRPVLRQTITLETHGDDAA